MFSLKEVPWVNFAAKTAGTSVSFSFRLHACIYYIFKYFGEHKTLSTIPIQTQKVVMIINSLEFEGVRSKVDMCASCGLVVLHFGFTRQTGERKS